MTIIPKISGVLRTSITWRAVAVKVVRSAPPAVTRPLAPWKSLLRNNAAQSGSPVVIPNHHPNVLNDAAAETDQIPAAVVAVPADG